MKRRRSCVRCHNGPRYVADDGIEAFLCVECIVAGQARAEAEEARKADPEHPRLWLMVNRGWFGGWGRTT